MNSSDIERAEHASRARSILMTVMTVVLLVNTALLVWIEADKADQAWRHALWAVMIGLWLTILATTGWMRLNRGMRRLMNDEVSLANRSRALQTGFWTAMALGVVFYFGSLTWEISAREAVQVLVNLTLAATLGRYSWLELR